MVVGSGQYLPASAHVARAGLVLPEHARAYVRPPPFGLHLAPALMRPAPLGLAVWQWLGIALAAAVAYGTAVTAVAILTRTVGVVARRTRSRTDDALVEAARRPLEVITGAIIFRVLLEPLGLTDATIEMANHATYTALVVGGAWLVLHVLDVAVAWFDERSLAEGHGPGGRSEVMILRRLAGVAIYVLAAALLLIQFEAVRGLGVSILASAGMASLVFGMAAQRSLAAIVAGLQFAIARPVRVGDQVGIEGEFGEIESVTLTYAVVKLLDQRRLVLPLTYFLEKPFYDWTRAGQELRGTVDVQVDYGAPTEPIVAELERICRSDPRWDGGACELRVTDSDGTSSTLCATVSASDAQNLNVLRSSVRERLLAFVRGFEGGRYMPRARSVDLASGT